MGLRLRFPKTNYDSIKNKNGDKVPNRFISLEVYSSSNWYIKSAESFLENFNTEIIQEIQKTSEMSFGFDDFRVMTALFKNNCYICKRIAKNNSYG